MALGGVAHRAGRGGALAAGEERGEAGLVADEEEARAGMPLGGDRKAFHDHSRRVIPAHSVHGNGRTNRSREG